MIISYRKFIIKKSLKKWRRFIASLGKYSAVVK